MRLLSPHRSSNACSLSHLRRRTTSCRINATCAAGPPKAITPSLRNNTATSRKRAGCWTPSGSLLTLLRDNVLRDHQVTASEERLSRVRERDPLVTYFSAGPRRAPRVVVADVRLLISRSGYQLLRSQARPPYSPTTSVM